MLNMTKVKLTKPQIKALARCAVNGASSRSTCLRWPTVRVLRARGLVTVEGEVVVWRASNNSRQHCAFDWTATITDAGRVALAVST